MDEPAFSSASLNIEKAVKDRYSRAAQSAQTELCIPTSYAEKYLKVIPDEIIERDYGCGDPTVHLQPGDTVLDLGSGTGKACYIAAQVVGAEGKVIGVDMNDEMLSLARKYQNQIGRELGFINTEFHKGMIQDLALDVDKVDSFLQKNPIKNHGDLMALDEFQRKLRQEETMISSHSIDVVISNCVLNLVRGADKSQLFREIYRVLKRGGRIAISDIVSDEKVPQQMQDDPELWSGCISGALQEAEFLKTLEQVGFYGIQIASRQKKPWRVVNGIEFRSVTVVAYKGKEGPCLERHQAVIYKGPWKEILDDDGHRFPRGERVAVCDKTYNIYSKKPYAESMELVKPYKEIPLKDAQPFPCDGATIIRHPQETKGSDYKLTTNDPGSDCTSNGDCC